MIWWCRFSKCRQNSRQLKQDWQETWKLMYYDKLSYFTVWLFILFYCLVWFVLEFPSGLINFLFLLDKPRCLMTVLTCVSGQWIVGSSAGQSKALWRLSAGSGPHRTLRRFDLGAKLGPNDPQQHDGGGLFAALLVRVGDLLGVWWKVGETAWWKRQEEEVNTGSGTSDEESLNLGEKIEKDRQSRKFLFWLIDCKYS